MAVTTAYMPGSSWRLVSSCPFSGFPTLFLTPPHFHFSHTIHHSFPHSFLHPSWQFCAHPQARKTVMEYFPVFSRGHGSEVKEPTLRSPDWLLTVTQGGQDPWHTPTSRALRAGSPPWSEELLGPPGDSACANLIFSKKMILLHSAFKKKTKTKPTRAKPWVWGGVAGGGRGLLSTVKGRWSLSFHCRKPIV